MRDTILEGKYHGNGHWDVPTQSKKWTAGKLAKTFVIAATLTSPITAYFGASTYLDSSSHPAPDSGLTVPADDVALTEPPTKAAITTSYAAPLRMEITPAPAPVIENGGDDITLAELCETASEDKQYFCDLALRLQDAMGIDGLALLATLAMETMLDRDFAMGATHDAQGLWQIQPAYLVTELRRHGQNLPFYADLEPDDPLKLAIDRLVRQQNDPAAVRRYEAELLNGFTDPLEQALNEFIYDDFRAGQLVSAVYLNQIPEARHDNFTGTWTNDFNDRIAVALQLYSYHKMGPNGVRYQMAIIDNPDFNMTAPNDTARMAEILQELQTNHGWTPLSVEENRRNAAANPAVFVMPDNPYACVPLQMRISVASHLGDFIPFPENSDLEQNFYNLFCGIQSPLAPIIATEETMPPMRPEGFYDQLVADGLIIVEPPTRPQMRPERRGQVVASATSSLAPGGGG